MKPVDGQVTIIFNPDDLRDCLRATVQLAAAIRTSHGAEAMQKLFANLGARGRKLQIRKNEDLLVAYKLRGLSIGKFSQRYAKALKTTPESLDRQLRRLLKKNPEFRKVDLDWVMTFSS